MAELKSMAEITLGGTFLRRALFLGGTFFNHCKYFFKYALLCHNHWSGVGGGWGGFYFWWVCEGASCTHKKEEFIRMTMSLWCIVNL